jgi:hypothetical protein
MRPVCLLHMGVVILLIGPGAGELDAVSSTERHQMPVDELAAIVRIQSAQGKRQLLGDRGERLEDAVLTFTHDRLPLDPAGVNVHGIQGMQKLPGGRCAGMGHQIDFQIAGARDVPVIRLDGDQMLEQGAGPGGPVEPSLQPVLVRVEPPVHLPHTDGKQLAFQRRAQGPPLSDPRKPDRHRRLEARSTQIARLLPDPRQHANGLRTVSRSPTRHTSRARAGRLPPIQQPHGILPVISTYPRHFI